MAEPTSTAPAVHVAFLDAGLAGLEAPIGHGAEEEGVPIRRVTVEAGEPVAAAYAAARSSTFGIGLALGGGRIVLHEAHMPPDRPVLAEAITAASSETARRFGSDAARMVVHLPLRMKNEDPPAASPRVESRTRDVGTAGPEPSAQDVARIVAAVVERLSARGTSR